jgi:hypothetical protein
LFIIRGFLFRVKPGLLKPPLHHPDIESVLIMELVLNLGWMLLGALLFCLWLRFAPRTGMSRQMQFVALAVLVLILFPVISMTDDVFAAQNQAEADCCLRRDHGFSAAQAPFPAVATVPPPVFAGLSFGFMRFAARRDFPVLVINHPGLEAIQNRPPPVA